MRRRFHYHSRWFDLKGISPLIAAIILIGIVVAVGGMLGPWIYRLTFSSGKNLYNQTQNQIFCNNMAYDFEYDYGIYGIHWNFDIPDGDWLAAKITNTGTVNVYDFFFELELDTPSGIEIKHFDPKEETQKTRANPLKPGETAVIEANITEDLPSGEDTLKRAKLMNRLCPDVYALWKSSI
ncbi:MAG: hypothetical protein DRP18_02180 [Candidatus Aenigmatarchaeota archaeon]|nr:MAG: hypothetical protein DRP18_02180 [Candidatus Aenigmarchaeota archaeon]